MFETNKVLLINEGSLSPFRRDENTISHFITPIVFNKYKIKDWMECQSSRFSSQKRMREFLLKYNNSINELIIVTKSYGCVEMYRLMMKKYEIHFKYFNKIKWICIDGYSLMGYSLDRKSFEKNDEWDNLKSHNFRQEKSIIKGARFKGVVNYKLHSSHSEIIKDKNLLYLLPKIL